MKTTKFLFTTLVFSALVACSKDDSPETPVNKAPGAFDLVDVAHGIYLKPKFAWNASVDPDGEAVTYDLYLDDQENPTTLVAENLTQPFFMATHSLLLVTEYHWKVIAKDPKGASVSSAVDTFTTRELNFPDAPVTEDAGFTEREGHSIVAFKDKLWIIGGLDLEYRNDVWISSNGENWRKIATDIIDTRNLFPPRYLHSTIVFDNKLWVIGGYGEGGRRSDVWFSEDGVSWTEATPNGEFSPRTGHTTVVFQDRLWLIGGFDENFETLNDVWSSSDGVSWKKETITANFPHRSRHASVVFADKIWVIGGFDQDHDYRTDVWSSTDGLDWKEVTSGAQFTRFAAGSSLVFDDKIMLLGVNDENGYTPNIWYSTDGKNWSVMTPTNDFPEIRLPIATVFQNKIWINNYRSQKIWALD